MTSNQLDNLLSAFEVRDRATLVREMRRLVISKPMVGRGTWAQLAKMANLVGEGRIAIEAAKLASVASPDDPVMVLELASTLLKHGRVEIARDVVEQLSRAQPNLPAAQYLLGYCRAQLGQASEAEDALRRAISMRPEAGDAWILLGTLSRFDTSGDDLRRLRSLCEQSKGDVPDVRGCLHLALGMLLDQIGEFDAAFEAFSIGARVFERSEKYSPELEREYTSEIVSEFGPKLGAHPQRSSVLDNKPIFVVGLPRSGTTLIEQILVSHSEVSGGGEINLLAPALFGLEEFTPAGLKRFIAARGEQDPWSFFGRTYLGLIEDRFGPNSRRVVDKSLNNFRYLGFALASMPAAKVIWMRRDPRDVAWSAFKTRFGGGEAWSWSLSKMKTHFDAERAMLQHWQRVFPDSIFVVPYEELVADPEKWIPATLKHCGLVDEPATRDFNRNQRAVGTASLAQVRQPLYSTAVGSWRKYERHLAPYFKDLPI